jgi:glycerate-2-kinase|tara:strand:+ start:143 stop:559 length:417 start_codon:yes stop_codon:yes gene_type:complete
MNKYLPQKSSERVLTEKQQKFLDCLIQTGGDPKLAANLAGYAEGSYLQVIKSLKHEIIELATQILAQSAPRAALKLVHVMESDEPIPQANVKLQAAQTILDRIGVSKTDKLDISVDDSGGSLFILPAKKVIDIEVTEN